ncbi:MAG: peptide chain release factor N(5)-glutamine methyltransferase, partial [Anaerolineae bacterium]|nr:peptide chain release factor N(5)-glutamine methyltransferase [Anaerolineae bacterium]
MPVEKTLKELLAEITLQLEPSSDTASLDAQVLVAHQLGKPRAWVMAHPEFQVSPAQYAQISHAMERLRNGEPLPYVVGHWEFYGKDFILTPDVLIPRPDTELLVEESIRWLKQHPTQRQAIDVGTGSGCIGISLAAAIPDLHLVLTDISGSALGVAQKNALKHVLSGRMEFVQANLLEGIAGYFDLICANLPYIPTDMLKTLPVAIREPVLALDGGQDGIHLTSRLLEQARRCLIPGGAIFLEIEALQGNEINMLAEKLYPAAQIKVIKSLAGWDRCVVIERSRFLVHICQREE